MEFVCKSSHATAIAGVFGTPVVSGVPFERTKYTNTNDFRPGFRLDALGWNGYGIDVPCGYFPVRQLLGWLTASDKDIVRTSRYKPQTVRPYSLGKDKLRYGTSIASAITFVNGGDPKGFGSRAPGWYHETDTVHATARGRFLYGDRGEPVYPTVGSISLWGHGFPGIIRNGVNNPDTAYCYPYVNAISHDGDLAFEFAGTAEHLQDGFDSTKRLIFNTTKSVRRVFRGQSASIQGYAQNYLRWNQTYADIATRDGVATVVLKYRFENFATSSHITYIGGVYPKSTCVYDVTLVIVASLVDPDVYALGDAGQHRIAMVPSISMTWSYELVSFDCNIPLPSSYGWGIQSGTVEAVFQTTKSHLYEKPGTLEQALHGFWDDVRVRYPGVKPIDRPLLRLRDWVNSVHMSYRDTAALSANDALSSYSSDSNFLESIPELPAILSYVENIVAFITVFNKAAKGDPGYFGALVDALASAYLAYQYGVKPNKADYAEARSIAHDLANGLIGQFDGTSNNLYGKFSYDVPTDGLGMHGEVHLTTRTKMVYVNDASGMLAMLLTLNQVALLPTLARVWDLVPFSFVVDWFLRMGDRFEYIDNAVLRLGFNLSYYVHTFQYTFTPSDSKSHHYMSDGSEDKPEWNIFIRERSLYHPLIKDGTKDYYPRKSFSTQRLAIAGSLMWLLA